MNAWHDVELGENPEEVFQAVIEIPRGSKNKYELDMRTGMLCLVRVMREAIELYATRIAPTFGR